MIYKEIESKFSIDSISEVRIRNNCPVVINYRGVSTFLKSSNGNYIMANQRDIERVISVASNYSLYTVENQVKQAFITAEKGYRIGLSGEFVCECGKSGIRTIKNIYSVNIRVPHKVENCSYKIFKYIYDGASIKNTLLISPPGAGKTTYLRDICYQFSKCDNPINILLVDERYEIAGIKDGVTTIDVGGCCDILSGASKGYAFEQGVRALKPDVIISDELMGESDIDGVKKTINSGVKMIATIHASDLNMILNKRELSDILNGKYFDRYIVLSSKNGPGKVEGVYDKNLKCMYC